MALIIATILTLVGGLGLLGFALRSVWEEFGPTGLIFLALAGCLVSGVVLGVCNSVPPLPSQRAEVPCR